MLSKPSTIAPPWNLPVVGETPEPMESLSETMGANEKNA